ncbi:MAG: hypothetical protein KME21_31805, partial [Desmonostoc vinosum HA7617-LM4]|nr:hypothetical protein [Desmonostoc vinosum HA7617-LM4]
MILDPPPQNLVLPLLELRDYCVRQLEEYERLYNKARSQLDHVEALLSNWTTKSNVNDKQPALETVGEAVAPDVQDIAEADLDLVEPIESEVDQAKNLEIDNQHQSPEVDSELAAFKEEKLEDNQQTSLLGVEIPMLSQYASLTRSEAIEQLLREHAGTVWHIDAIVEALYGELDKDVFKVAKDRVQSTLTHGRKSKRWSLVPNNPGHYTLVLSLLPDKPTIHNLRQSKRQNQQPYVVPKAPSVPMLKAYEGQFLIDAVSSFLEQNAGKVFKVESIITGVYGELDTQSIAQVKSSVLKELSRGHGTGRFTRVPGEIGIYTWDVNNQTPKLTADESPHDQQSVFFSLPDDISDADLTDEPKESEPTHTQLSLPVTDEIDSSLRVLEIPMLPQYENLSRIDAVKKLLQEYIGTVCHIDFILLKLYGELEPKLFKIVKLRVQSTLTQGKENGYWSAVPEEPGCYTLDLGLVANNGFGAAKRTKS